MGKLATTCTIGCRRRDQVGDMPIQSPTGRVHSVARKVEVSGDVSTRTITAAVTVHNGSDQDLMVTPMQYQQTSAYLKGEPRSLLRGTDNVVRVIARINDCSNPRLDDAYVPDAGLGGSTATAPGVNFNVQSNDTPQIGGGSIAALFPRAEQAQVTSLLTQMCGDTPSATERVVSAGRSPVDASVEFASNGDPSTVALRMTVDVATTAERVHLADAQAPEDLANGAVATLTGATATVTRGHARLTVDWALSCGNGMGPPMAQLWLSSGGRTWPVRATLADQPLARAYLAACPQVTPQDLQGMGWPST